MPPPASGQESQKSAQEIAHHRRTADRDLPEATLDSYKRYLQLCRKTITQKWKDKNKVYSFHKPPTVYIAKGKAHKPYEFGNKIGLLVHDS